MTTVDTPRTEHPARVRRVPDPPRLVDDLDAALDAGDATLDRLAGRDAADERDRFETLLLLYDALLGPVTPPATRARSAAHPAVVAVKRRLEEAWLAELAAAGPPCAALADDPAAYLRVLAARDRLHPVHRWVARSASGPDLVRFLALEGGPDAGFDDLVAICQVGLTGAAKGELAANYWDEMGRGDPAQVHRRLHADLAEAVAMPRLPAAEQPVEGLARAALGGLLATNRWLLPEMVGALGLIELQAGPRCTLVLRGLRRIGAPEPALPFYAVHAEVDPRHGRDWLDHVVTPLVAEDPGWGPGIVRGACWRQHLDRAFLDAAGRMLVP